MPRILITGATGFIGSWLTRHYLEKHYEVIAHGSSRASVFKLKSSLEQKKVNIDSLMLWNQDFLEKEWNWEVFGEKIDAIIHTAAATRVREGTIDNYERYFQLNVVAPNYLAKKALDNDVSHFVHLSTGQVFGLQDAFPISESSEKRPINLYGITKLIGERVVESIGMLGLSYTIVRPFSVYGEGHFNIISIIYDKLQNNQIIQVFGDGTQSRAFSHVLDFCSAVDAILFNKKCFGEAYNLSGPMEYSVIDIIKLLANKLSKKPQIEYKKGLVNELKRNIASLEKIEKLGFTPKYTLEEYIKNEI